MQISAPIPIFYLPENLWSLFTRPGRELTVRVLQIEGKTLYLEMGGYKFQARLGGTLNPEDLKTGDLIRVKVVKSEGPIILQLIETEKETSPQKFLYLFAQVKPKSENLSSQNLNKEMSFLTRIFKNLISKSEEKSKSLKSVEDFLGKEVKFIQPNVEEDRVFLPFVFHQDKSWGYLEIKPENKGEKVRLFFLRLFFSYLGLIEAIFAYTNHSLELDLYFADKRSAEFAKEFLRELREDLFISNKSIIINLHKRDIEPGYIIEKVG